MEYLLVFVSYHLHERWTVQRQTVVISHTLPSALWHSALVFLYDQPNNATFCQKNESFQYKAALAITGAIQGTSQEKLLEELGLEILKSPRWLRRLCCMYKIENIGIPKYFTDLTPKRQIAYNIGNRNK